MYSHRTSSLTLPTTTNSGALAPVIPFSQLAVHGVSDKAKVGVLTLPRCVGARPDLQLPPVVGDRIGHIHTLFWMLSPVNAALAIRRDRPQHILWRRIVTIPELQMVSARRVQAQLRVLCPPYAARRAIWGHQQLLLVGIVWVTIPNLQCGPRFGSSDVQAFGGMQQPADGSRLDAHCAHERDHVVRIPSAQERSSAAPRMQRQCADQ
mmetsp:Transcript_47663/g.110426  ORF Transcript_47663/g.110426 Transcript_47663/m.110426 type:complete len:208 (+) Transcript_47663:329-952(+)